jgi:hypothetical protein
MKVYVNVSKTIKNRKNGKIHIEKTKLVKCTIFG